ncbi:MAG: hypothetical protein R3274_04380 [Desulfobacterales bacterium]|nr:hypothetical protein [Desulfobacterales bacterium]
MIVSFHPLFEADRNIICAGREPDADDLAAIKAAEAVILPQGCRQSLYEMTSENCRHVFPNYDARFAYPGKIGQMQLFQKYGAPHPRTETYAALNDLKKRYGENPKDLTFKMPFVLKFDWGGEGETVFLINTREDLDQILQKAFDFERSGQQGFLIQEYVPIQGRTLRVVIIGQSLFSYWRIQENADMFVSNVSQGARIDAAFAPGKQEIARGFVKDFCAGSRINLAGFDVIFAAHKDETEPLMLEINYFFGRRGLGGSDAYYKILKQEIKNWLGNRLGKQAL